MYYPFFRGRQFELLALRELIEKGLIGEKICPVIEPIKATSTLSKTLSAFIESGLSCALVMNPEVSDFAKYFIDEKTNAPVVKDIKKCLEYDNILKAYILNKGTKAYLKNTDVDLSKIITISTSQDGLEVHEHLFKKIMPKASLIPESTRFRRALIEPKILLGDRFNKKPRNADYLKKEDEFFSEDHIYYNEEGYQGFADYSVIGSDFSESGFAPLAVVIHIVYFDKSHILRIHHFVSNSNDDISDPAGKFGEAVSKLHNWVVEGQLSSTYGLNALEECYREGKYPGLGTVKKYSIMHHLELMNSFLGGE